MTSITPEEIKDTIEYINNYGYTSTDYKNAAIYAQQRFKKEVMNDPVIKNKFNIEWRENSDLNYYCPISLRKDNPEPCSVQGDDCKCSNGTGVFNKKGCEDNSFNPTVIDTTTTGNCFTTPEDEMENKPPYLEYNEDNQKCILGNVLLKDFCQCPVLRRDEFVNGATNCPPFKYNNSSGKCYMSDKYCEWMGVSYTDQNDDGVPDCYRPAGQVFFEDIFLLGQTLYRQIFGQGPRDPSYWQTENYKNNPEIKNLLERVRKSIKPNIEVLIDDHFIKNKKILKKNRGGKGINLYDIEWKNGKKSTGFIESELKNKYSKYIIKKKGAKFLKLNFKDLPKDDIHLKRIYGLSDSKNLIENIQKFFENKNIKK